ncbi:MAG: YfcC family protein [Clostridia bacterium]|nr:YfcC family protein [Clostridia bacterium]
MQTKEEMQNAEVKEKEEPFSHIGRKSFFVVMILLTTIIIASWLLTFFVPQGSYLRDENGMIINGTYVEGKPKGIAFWRVITAPFRVFASEDAVTIIMISIFLLVMSGVFNLLEKTGGIRVIIGRTVRKFSHRKQLVVCATAFIFMAFGSFFGMFEELVTLLPLIIVFMLSMGFDTLTGLGVCMMAACFGFSAAISNPFSVGIVSELAGIPIFKGAWLRILFFALVFTAVCAFLLLHIKKITKDPTRSLTYEIDQKKRLSLNMSLEQETAQERKIFNAYIIFFAAQLVVLILIASIRAISGLAIPILAVTFLVGGIIAGLIVCEKKTDVFKHMGSGALAMIPAIVMIAMASSVKLIMSESGILDTVMYGIIDTLIGKNKFLCVILIYFLILFLQIFIGSSSAKIMLIMPIILPVATTIGLSPTVVILTYCIADGFTDVILPTNPVLLIGLSMANVSYGKWVKWTWKFQVLMFLATILLLMLAVQIGY